MSRALFHNDLILGDVSSTPESSGTIVMLVDTILFTPSPPYRSYLNNKVKTSYLFKTYDWISCNGTTVPPPISTLTSLMKTLAPACGVTLK